MKKYLCIHGHFYQPPRENPWLEEIEAQESAYPYRDWNERITAECYAPNGASRILDRDKIIEIVNNYSKISFNFGPTLLSWMERRTPETYAAILEADKESLKNFGGHGSAIAQVYNHLIMPLATRKDKEIQIVWGLRDFESRFKRKSEGMWLAETAVDIETLELLAEHGVKYTILSPRQAQRIRKIGDEKWTDVSGERIDPKIPYICNLPNGKSISLFFYDGPISRAVAFDGLLNNGENLARRLLSAYTGSGDTQLVHIATDGETYGHHHKHGDMALGYCLYYIESNDLAKITVYGEFLEIYPPAYEVMIIERTSWSCFHGIERWRSNCGCNTGTAASQSWREPLRGAQDWLRLHLEPLYEKEIIKYFKDEWQAKLDFIAVILDRSQQSLNHFFEKHQLRPLTDAERIKVLQLLEMERNALLMYTSCGWFFDEISGIETVQVIQYAARAMQLAKEVAGEDYEEEYLRILKQARSNVAGIKNGGRVYEWYVKPASVDTKRVAAHYAVSSLFESFPKKADIYSFSTEQLQHEVVQNKEWKLVFGKVSIFSKISFESHTTFYAVSHLGGHDLSGGISEEMTDEVFEEAKREIKVAFEKGDQKQTIHLISKYFGSAEYSFHHVFADENRKIFKHVLQGALTEIETAMRKTYETQHSLISVMRDTHTPLPKALKTAAEFTLNHDLRELIESEMPDPEKVSELMEELRELSLELDHETLSYVSVKVVNDLIDRFYKNPDDLDLLKKLDKRLEAIDKLYLKLDLWHAQNTLFAISIKNYGSKRVAAMQGDSTAKQWIRFFQGISNYLKVEV
ncbi:MAG: DUF3536 domain-containing protein [Chloroherpetonaceae bacterium]|nr:DUF3536 domain-containing protein [Chloroherpetonaceae bacterium]